MPFKPVLVRERDCYTVRGIANKLGISAEDALACVRSLSARGVLTLRSDSLPDGYDPGGDAEAIGKYQVTWVGLARFKGKLLVAYPKYYPLGTEPSEDELKQVFRVLRKASGGLASIGAADPDALEDGGSFALMLRLLESYEENGIYSNYVRVLRDNGTGEIAWEPTIAALQPFMDGDAPAYFDLKTCDTSRDAADFVERLHRCVLTRCSADLEAWGIDEMLGLAPVRISGEELEDFGDAEAVSYRLEQERSVQFVTWKQDVIDMLLRYLNPGEEYAAPEDELCLGTTSFYHAWEEACKAAFGDRLADRLDSLGVELRGEWTMRGRETLLGIIPRPEWARYDAEGVEEPCGEVDTLIPDVVAVHGDGAGGLAFCIYDAKYYTPTLGERVRGVPGVESVTKQVLYQSAYRRFVLDCCFSRVANVFLVPRHSGCARRLGRVAFPGVFEPLGGPFTDGVEMWELPAEDVFECYLRGELIDEGVLRGVIGVR